MDAGIKALFSVGVFAGITQLDGGLRRILVNVRADQERQKQLAGLPADWKGVIVDLPGGGVLTTDASFEAALLREVLEETECRAQIAGPVLLAPELIRPDGQKPIYDVALIWPVAILGVPQPTAEASGHLWITPSDIANELNVRFPGKLGKNGRSARMALAALYWWCNH